MDNVLNRFSAQYVTYNQRTARLFPGNLLAQPRQNARPLATANITNESGTQELQVRKSN